MSESDHKQQILEKLKLITDEPEIENLQFNFIEYSQQITNILIDEKLQPPFTIGIHGEWGTGKTTLIKKIKKDLEKTNDRNLKIIEFDAWKYERADIVTALLQKIEKKFNNKHKTREFAKAVGLFVADQALRHYTGISLRDPVKHFRNFISKIETVAESLEKIVGSNRLIIFVDDLDRCHVENVLEMLESIKMLLSVKNVIFVIAVDMTKIERAWELRYNSETGTVEGREHVEKIFQLKLSLPPKSDEELEKYAKQFAESFADTDIKYLINNTPRNPRKIKRTLNLLYFLLLNLEIPGKNQKEKNKNLNIYLETLITWISLTMNHPDIAKTVSLSPSYLIIASTICKDVEYFDKLKKLLVKMEDPDKWNQNPYRFDLLPKSVLEILENIVTKDEKAYRTMRRYALQRNIDFTTDLYSDQAWVKGSSYNVVLEPLNIIIKTAGLIGI